MQCKGKVVAHVVVPSALIEALVTVESPAGAMENTPFLSLHRIEKCESVPG